jgi:hypothetical protein
LKEQNGGSCPPPSQSKITLDSLELYTSHLPERIKPWTGWNFIVPICLRYLLSQTGYKL